MSETPSAAPAAHVAPPEQEDWEIQRDAYKASADAAFRGGNFAEAVTQYTHSLELDPTNHVLLSNRSAAHLKLHHKSKSLQDAKACLEANPTFSKGYSRLAAAQQSLGRWKDAQESYQKLLSLDPNNAVAKQGLEDCSAKVKEQQEEEAKQKEETKKEEETKADGPVDEDDLLDDFFSEVETATAATNVIVEEEGPKIISNQKKDLGTAAQQIERLLAPNHQWRNLNPFYVLDMSHESSVDDVSRRYKALSLLLHPDKCRTLENAKEAYDEVQRAKAMLLNNEDKARHVRGLVEQGFRKGKQVWQQEGKQKGMSLQEVQEKEVQRIFAQIEFQRREVEKRERKQEQRERQQEEDELSKERKERQFDKNWREENRVDKRIGNWRDFQKKKKPKL
jgi:tetratricopeptide (TPR) repeat protein